MDKFLVRALASMTREESGTAAVEREHGAAAILTNLGAYQDSRHLHFHIHSGEKSTGATS